MFAWIAQSRKAIGAFVTAVIIWCSQTDLTHITKGDWIALAIVVAGSLGVYQVQNAPAPVKNTDGVPQDNSVVTPDDPTAGFPPTLPPSELPVADQAAGL